MWLHTDGIDVPSRAASSATPIPGLPSIRPSSESCPARHARGVHLAAQVTVQVEQHRPEPVGDVDGLVGGDWHQCKLII